jgi:hypothetical protein
MVKASLTVAGKTAYFNETYEASKAAITVTGKSFVANLLTLVAVTKATLTIAGQSAYSNASLVLSKAALTIRGKAYSISSALVKLWRMVFDSAFSGRVGQLVVSGSATLADIFGTTPKINQQVTFVVSSSDITEDITCASQAEVVGSKYPAFFIESTTDIDYSKELYMASAEAEVVEQTA